MLFLMIVSLNAQTNAPSIQSGVTFQWSDNQTHQNQSATIESITVNGNVYFNFGAPTGYEMTQLGPSGHGFNNIRLNGVRIESTSASPTWDANALIAFQSLNLNNYFECNGNGDNICDNYTAENTTDAQRQTLTYDGGIVSSSSGVIAITERNANNCYHIEFFGIPEDGGPEQSLGETFVNNAGGSHWGFGGTGSSSSLGTAGALNPPPTGSDYWLSDRVIENRGTIGIAIFYLNDIAPTGSLITKATITAATNDNGDGKMFILTLPDFDNDGRSDVDDLDDDNDGIKDTDESNGIDPSADHDVDGVPNYKDPNFCVLNASGVCANLDADSDGIPNHFDLDADNDGIPDVIESGGTDRGFVNNSFVIIRDGYADGKVGDTPTTDGIPSSAGTGTIPFNTDGTGNYDFLDIDSDDDGIPDNVEMQPTIGYLSPSGIGATITDNNNDGVDDTYGVSFPIEDTDRDGIYDYVDLDSDNDGLPDIEENGMADEVVLFLDSDNDGLDVLFEGGNSNDANDVNDEIDNPSASVLPDSDGDLYSSGDLDYRDLFNINPPVSATVDFDGIDDYLSGDSLIEGLGEVTIMAWVKIDASNSGNSYATIAGEGDAFKIYAQNGNQLRLSMRTTAGSQQTLNGIDVEYDEWHHVAATFSNNTGRLNIYIDGVEQGSQTNVNLIGETLSSTNIWNGNFEVGRRSMNYTNKQYFTGNIDEVRVFDAALTEEQIQQMVYQEIELDNGLVQGMIVPKQIKDTKTLETVPWSRLIAYYPMTDIKNNTTSDYSGNDRILNLMNITTIQEQTAPMPYETGNNGNWTSQSTWLHGDVWDIEDATKNKDWSIVHIKHNITSSSSHTNLGLLIDSNRTFTVNGDQKVENNWYLELNGTLDLLGDSQLIQTNTSDLVTSANGKIIRRQEGTNNKYWYNYWASPVGFTGVTSLSNNNLESDNENNTTFNLGMLKKPDGSNFQFTSSLHQTGKISTYWLYTYINGLTYYDWAQLSQSSPLQPGVGYTQKGTGIAGSEQQYLFEGKPNNGTIVIPVTDTGGAGSVPAVSKTDYLFGNPYASAIDLHKFIDDNIGVIDGTIQLWQQWSGNSHILDEYNGGYAQVNKTGAIRAYQFVGLEGATNGNQDGTKIPTRYLPVGQGFMTEIISNGDVVFNNDQRIFIKEADANGSYGNGSVFFRNGGDQDTGQNQNESEETEETLMQKLRLEFNSVDGPTTRRELLLGFSEETSDDYDYGYEAINVDGNDDDLNLILDNQLMTIQAYSSITEDKIVPLVLTTSGAYNYTIKLTEEENIANDQEIYLRDNLTGEYFDLKSYEPYEFSSDAGEFTDRLEIVFHQQENETLSQIDQDLKALNLYYAIGRKKIVVLNPTNEELKSIEVINMVGQSVQRINMFEGSYNEYEVTNLNTGTYIIKLTTATNTSITKKIIVK